MKNIEKKKRKSFAWKISPSFHDEIERHLKELENTYKKRVPKFKWLMEAVTEKLYRLNESQNELVNERERVGFLIDPLTFSQLEERIDNIRKHVDKYSKQQLIFEALQEKLSLEEEQIKQKYSEQRLLLNELREKNERC